MNWYLEVLKKYAEFSGRARRSEYWYFVLFNLIFIIILAVLSMVPGLIILYVLYALGVLIPSLAVVVRRLHDINKSGWNILWSLIPLVGGIILLVYLASNGDSGINAYGPDPKEQQPLGDPSMLDSNIV